MDTIETGIEVLDRRLGGGVPAGSIVALLAPPSSSAELLLYELTNEHPTVYLSTIRTEAAVRDALRATPAQTGDARVIELRGGEVLDRANRAIGQLGEGQTLIIDPADSLEECASNRYVSFLNDLQTQLQNTRGYAVLNCLGGDQTPENRRLTLHAADIVFDLETEVRGSTLVTRMFVPKNRGGRAVTEEIKLELVDHVAIDTSRDIA